MHLHGIRPFDYLEGGKSSVILLFELIYNINFSYYKHEIMLTIEKSYNLWKLHLQIYFYTLIVDCFYINMATAGNTIPLLASWFHYFTNSSKANLLRRVSSKSAAWVAIVWIQQFLTAPVRMPGHHATKFMFYYSPIFLHFKLILKMLFHTLYYLNIIKISLFVYIILVSMEVNHTNTHYITFLKRI